MAKKITIQETPKIAEEVTQEESVLVTFSGSGLGRFQVEDNKALVKPSELKENEKLVEANGKKYIEVTEPSHTYLL